MTLVLYRKFYEEEQFNAVVEILEKHGIEHLATEDRESLDSLYGDKQFKRYFFIKIKKEDFETVDNVLVEQAASHLEAVDRDHYLFSFTDDELHDVILKADEWSELDFLLAQKILRERGVPVDQEKIKQMRNERIKELARPDEKNRIWIVVGYLSALLGGILGFFIGWHLNTFKKTLPNGERIFAYTKRDRDHGNRILITSIVMFAFWVLAAVVSTSL